MSCCGPNSGAKYGAPCASLPPASSTRYPDAHLAPKINPRLWKRAPNGASQFTDDCNTAVSDDPLPPFTYGGATLAACHFPLGGYSCGQVSLSGDGTLNGWTVLNQGHAAERTPLANMPANFFGVCATPAGGAPQGYVLATPANYTDENQALEIHNEAHVSPSQVQRLQTLPGINSLEIVGRYPIADVTYNINEFPVDVSLEAVSPLIPGDPVSSSLPVAVFTFTVKNPSTTTACSVRLMEAQQNFVGWDGATDCTKSHPFWGGNVNTPFVSTDNTHAGLFMTNPSVASTSGDAGNIAVSAVFSPGTTAGVITSATSDEDLWNKFMANSVTPAGKAVPTPPSAAGTSYAGAAVHAFTLAPGASQSVTFVLSWFFPNRMRDACVGKRYEAILPPVLGNRYSNWFKDAQGAAAYLVQKSEALLSTTRLYTNTMFRSTIPPTVLDSAAGRVAVWRSATMWWTQDGIVMGCEGNRCCPLNCSHVYGYTMLLERLFPSLAKDMSYSSFVRNYIPGSGVSMRFKTGGWAIDGALASVIKTYLCVRQADPSGTFLRTVYPNVKDQMQLILTNFDTANDGVIRSEQQNTYDTAMAGANTFIGSYYVTALRCTAIMASFMGDRAFNAVCSARATLAAKNYDTICWNEKFGYYIADVTIKNCAHSYGPGCFVDQLCAAGLSFAAGLGYVFNEDHEKSARLAIAKNNKMTMPPFKDMQKHFYPGDTGITVCTYPNGKLGDGMQYDTLVSAGFTSPVIAGLIADKSLDAALEVVGNIRQRQDGRNRSPWNEPECNLLYSRSMAHWNLFDQACGQSYDCTKGSLAFDPKWNASAFNCFFVCADGWGEYTQSGPTDLSSGTATLATLYGEVQLKSLSVGFTATSATATLDGAPVAGKFVSGTFTFDAEVTITTGSKLTLTLKSTYTACSMVSSSSSCCVPKKTVCAPQTSTSCCPPGTPREVCCPEKQPAGCCEKNDASVANGGGITTALILHQPTSHVRTLLIFAIGLILGMYWEHLVRFCRAGLM